MKVSEEIKNIINECMSHPRTGAAFTREARETLRSRCSRDPLFFNYHVLGYQDCDTFLHRDMVVRWVNRLHRRYTLWMVSRMHLKTSLWTIGMNLWELATIDPTLRILLVNAVLSNAEDMMSEIRTHIETNEIFRWLYPEMCPDLGSTARAKKCKMTSERIDLANSGRAGKREGTFECLGVEMSLVSKHYNRLHFDDAENDQNVTTSEYRDKIWRWFLNSFQLRHSPQTSRVSVVGTVWHEDGIHRRIIKREEKRRESGKKPRWLLYRRPVMEVNPDTGDKLPIWPERFDEQVCQELKEELGSYIFACQFELNPISSEEAIFKRHLIKFIEEDDVPLNVRNFAAVDLGVGGDSDRQDPTVVTVASFDCDNKMYVRQIVRLKKVSPLDLIDLLHTLQKMWNLEAVAIETVIFQKTILKFYRDYSTEKHFYINWKEMIRQTTQKFKRFLALQPVVERGNFHIVEDIQNAEDAVQEMTSVTPEHMPTHDDILDTLADIHAIHYAAQSESEITDPPKGSYDAVYGNLEDDDEEEIMAGSGAIGRDFWRAE